MAKPHLIISRLMLCIIVFFAVSIEPFVQAAEQHASCFKYEILNLLVLNIPSDVYVNKSTPYNLGFPVYRFRMARNKKYILTLQIDDRDEPGFLSPSEIRRAQSFRLHGMQAWRRDRGGTVEVQIRLPKPRGCAVQYFALYEFQASVKVADHIVNSSSPKRPYRCENAVP